MHFVVERDALLACVQAAAKLKAELGMYAENFGRVVMRESNGMLHISATNATTHLDAYLPATFHSSDHPISTKSKEFAYLLRRHVGGKEVEISGDDQSDMAQIRGSGDWQSFPNEHDRTWDSHEHEPACEFATMSIESLARALYIADDFMSNMPDRQYYGLHAELLKQDVVRFCATNGHMLGIADLCSGVRSSDGKRSMYVEQPAVQAVISCLHLWDCAPVGAADCEISIAERLKQHEDGEVWELDPLAVFDLSGGGYRAVVSTIQRGKFAEYGKILPTPEHDGVLLEAAADDLKQLAQTASRAAKGKSSKSRGKVGFRFFYDVPSDGVAVRIGYAVPVPGGNKPTKVSLEDGDESVPDYAVETHQLPGGYFGRLVGNGLPEVEDMDKADTMIVSINAEYLAAAVKHMSGHVLMKFHGCFDLIEICETVPQPDRFYCIAMPIRDAFTKEEL